MEHIDAASAEFERVAGQLPADSWDRPTPSEMSVRQLIEHVVVGNRFRDEARANLAGDPLGDDPVAAVVDSAREQWTAFAATSPERPVAGPGGDIPASAFLRFRLVDLVVHAWDLLRAAGLDESLDPEVVADFVEWSSPTWTRWSPPAPMGQAPAGPCHRAPRSRHACSTGSGAARSPQGS